MNITSSKTISRLELEKVAEMLQTENFCRNDLNVLYVLLCGQEITSEQRAYYVEKIGIMIQSTPEFILPDNARESVREKIESIILNAHSEQYLLSMQSKKGGTTKQPVI